MHHVEEKTLMHMMKVAKQVSLSLEKTYQPERITMAVIGYEVPHAHLHLIPSTDVHDVTFKPMLDGTLGQMTGDELEAEAEKIRGNL